jgi:hypothetical protein
MVLLPFKNVSSAFLSSVFKGRSSFNTMRRWSSLPAALVVGAALAGVSATKNNVLLLVADDLRPEMGAFGGRALTPHIDALAAKSLVLTSNYVQQAVCGPTRASFMTGRRPETLRTVSHVVPTYWRAKTFNFTSLPQAFKEAGWSAFCISPAMIHSSVASSHTAVALKVTPGGSVRHLSGFGCLTFRSDCDVATPKATPLFPCLARLSPTWLATRSLPSRQRPPSRWLRSPTTSVHFPLRFLF